VPEVVKRAAGKPMREIAFSYAGSLDNLAAQGAAHRRGDQIDRELQTWARKCLTGYDS
jgi:hypothetical protein